jgi:deoxyadenosine/deoxycytidine kinase
LKNNNNKVFIINNNINNMNNLNRLNDNNNKIIISVEGNIGVGKSTFINILKSKWENSEVVSEPVDLWKELVNSDGKNILQTFYEDIPRWAYSFQNVACITRMIKIEDSIRNSDSKYIFLDRSLGTDKNVFEAMLHDQGKINQIEHSMYNLWCDFYHKYVRSQDNQIYIYLKANPKTCAKRIKKRGRIEEESIELEYLEGLNKYHDKWLLDKSIQNNVIIIDCEEDFETDELKHLNMINQIKTKLDLIMNKNKIIIDYESDTKNKKDKKIFLENL